MSNHANQAWKPSQWTPVLGYTTCSKCSRAASDTGARRCRCTNTLIGFPARVIRAVNENAPLLLAPAQWTRTSRGSRARNWSCRQSGRRSTSERSQQAPTGRLPALPTPPATGDRTTTQSRNIKRKDYTGTNKKGAQQVNPRKSWTLYGNRDAHDTTALLFDTWGAGGGGGHFYVMQKFTRYVLHIKDGDKMTSTFRGNNRWRDSSQTSPFHSLQTSSRQFDKTTRSSTYHRNCDLRQDTDVLYGRQSHLAQEMILGKRLLQSFLNEGLV